MLAPGAGGRPKRRLRRDCDCRYEFVDAAPRRIFLDGDRQRRFGLAAEASAAGGKAAAADTINRASAPQGSDQLAGNPDFLIFLAFGLLTVAVVAAAWNDDEEPTSP